jgi:hypothetical protein
MNGRIYDPTLGRFLQADPHIQAPQNSQSYNRYVYVLQGTYIDIQNSNTMDILDTTIMVALLGLLLILLVSFGTAH